MPAQPLPLLVFLARPARSRYTPWMADAARILEEALLLAPDQRARIARELIQSLVGTSGTEPNPKVEAIRAALVEGEQSGIAEDSSLAGILTELRASRAR